MSEKLLEPGESIEYVCDVWSPPNQAGKAGEKRVVGETITKFAARLLCKGGFVRRIESKTERSKGVRGTDSAADQGKTAAKED